MEPRPDNTPTAAPARVRLCDQCGRVNVPFARFCGSCGRWLDGSGEAETPAGRLVQARQLADDGLFRDARRLYLKAARQSPADPKPLIELARMYVRRGEPGRAKACYKLALGRDRNCWQAWAEGAECCGRFQLFRRSWWLANAARAGVASGRGVDPQVRIRFLEHYRRLRGWEQWLIRQLTGQPI